MPDLETYCEATIHSPCWVRDLLTDATVVFYVRTNIGFDQKAEFLIRQTQKTSCKIQFGSLFTFLKHQTTKVENGRKKFFFSRKLFSALYHVSFEFSRLLVFGRVSLFGVFVHCTALGGNFWRIFMFFTKILSRLFFFAARCSKTCFDRILCFDIYLSYWREIRH